MTLLNTSRPLSLREIASLVNGYPDPKNQLTLRRAFERDKALLREEGIPVVTVPIPTDDQAGYRIRREDYFLQDLQLTPDEQLSLNLAAVAVNFNTNYALDALFKLGLPVLPALDASTSLYNLDSVPVMQAAALPFSENLPILYEALCTKSIVSFEYKGVTREVKPLSCFFKFGHWYVATWDIKVGQLKTFRVDRITGKPQIVKHDGNTDLYSGLPSLSLESLPAPWEAGDEPFISVQIAVDPFYLSRSGSEIDFDSIAKDNSVILEQREDGFVVLELKVANQDAFRSWLLGMLDHVELISPLTLRQELLKWLEEMASGPSKRALNAAKQYFKKPNQPFGGSSQSEKCSFFADGFPFAVSAPSSSSGVTSSASKHAGVAWRLHRLLAVLAYLARVHTAQVSELQTRFGMSRRELVGELELASCCGTPPYTPDSLMEIMIDKTTVQANLSSGPASELMIPRRLNAREGLALLVSAQAILAIPGADANRHLTSAMEKLQKALGIRGQVSVTINEPKLLSELRAKVTDAINMKKCLRIRYYSLSQDKSTTRQIEPLRVFAAGGYWYLDAWCHKRDGVRRFRVDRIQSVVLTQTPAEKVIPSISAESFVPSPDGWVVRMLIPNQAAWVGETYPLLAIQALSGGWMLVEIAIGGIAFLKRLLLRLGADAVILSPPEMAGLGAETANELIKLYAAV